MYTVIVNARTCSNRSLTHTYAHIQTHNHTITDTCMQHTHACTLRECKLYVIYTHIRTWCCGVGPFQVSVGGGSQET